MGNKLNDKHKTSVTMANLVKQSDVFSRERETFNFTTLSVIEHTQPDTSLCGCMRPQSCTICRTMAESNEFQREKNQLIKDEEDFREEATNEF